MTLSDTKTFLADEVAWAIESARRQLIELKPTLEGDEAHEAHYALNRLNVAQYEVDKALEELHIEKPWLEGQQGSLF